MGWERFREWVRCHCFEEAKDEEKKKEGKEPEEPGEGLQGSLDEEEYW